jgi:hypothetical protein
VKSGNCLATIPDYSGASGEALLLKKVIAEIAVAYGGQEARALAASRPFVPPEAIPELM